MALQKGSYTSIRSYREVTAGVEATGNGLVLPIVSAPDLGLTQPLEQAPVLRGTRHLSAPSEGDKSVGGTINVQPDTRAAAFMIDDFFADTTSQVDTPSAGLNTHTSIVGAQPRSLTLEKWYPQIPGSFREIGCQYNSLSMDVGASGFLQWAFGVIGIDERDTIEATPIDATPTAYEALGLRLPSATITEGGSGITHATGVSIQMGQNIDGIRTIGNLGRFGELPAGMFAVTGSLSLIFKELTHYNKAKARTKSSLVLTFPGQVASHSVQLLLDEIMYAITSPGIPGPAGLIATLDFIAFVGTGTSTARMITVNDIASLAAIP